MDTTKSKTNNNNERKEDMKIERQAADVVNTQHLAFYKRHKLLREIGSNLGESEPFSRLRDINGHRAMIGFNYKTIRKACGIPLDEMADKCELSVERLKELEDCGFLTILRGKYCEVSFENALFKNIYVGYLQLVLSCYDFETDGIYFEEMIELNKAIVSDIDNQEWDRKAFEPKFIMQVYRNFKKAYEEIHEILAPYLDI